MSIHLKSLLCPTFGVVCVLMRRCCSLNGKFLHTWFSVYPQPESDGSHTSVPLASRERKANTTIRIWPTAETDDGGDVYGDYSNDEGEREWRGGEKRMRERKREREREAGRQTKTDRQSDRDSADRQTQRSRLTKRRDKEKERQKKLLGGHGRRKYKGEK